MGDSCPLCGSSLVAENDFNSHSHDPGLYRVYECGSSWMLPHDGEMRMRTGMGSNDTSTPYYTEPPAWHRYTETDACIRRQRNQLQAKVERLHAIVNGVTDAFEKKMDGELAYDERKAVIACRNEAAEAAGGGA